MNANRIFLSLAAPAVLFNASPLPAAAPPGELAPPVQILAGDAPISVDIGHAHPFVHDMDGDGKRDLLVGQFGAGKLRIYRNVGTDKEPRYTDFTWFQAGGKDATVPAG
jgi:hypothetical protein